jgi:hypothetical protein
VLGGNGEGILVSSPDPSDIGCSMDQYGCDQVVRLGGAGGWKCVQVTKVKGLRGRSNHAVFRPVYWRGQEPPPI